VLVGFDIQIAGSGLQSTANSDYARPMSLEAYSFFGYPDVKLLGMWSWHANTPQILVYGISRVARSNTTRRLPFAGPSIGTARFSASTKGSLQFL
jgi:hypothetical protein